jgi:hypothetical protein
VDTLPVKTTDQGGFADRLILSSLSGILLDVFSNITFSFYHLTAFLDLPGLR